MATKPKSRGRRSSVAAAGSGSGSGVRVAVRVRPFNGRERRRRSPCVISMDGATTTLTMKRSGGAPPQVHTFTYDYSFWSHEQGDSFASQEAVFQALGGEVVQQAMAGFNTSVFAYGQTGAGKSYSMMGGKGDDRGLIPRICEGMFSAGTAASPGAGPVCKVEVSYLEIYMEQVKDLLNPSNTRKLRVREHATTGPYVEDLTQVPVRSFEEVAALMEEGAIVRTVAATSMNAESSRSHAIFTLRVAQVEETAGGDVASKVSKINLVDLAGSERSSSTKATGKRLKEGSAINKSLSTLGRVIHTLATPSLGGIYIVPYRDSVLTWLLKESLGGNAKTTMLAAISPAAVNQDETLSTLRYANQAKMIVNKAVVNQDPTAALIKELRAEINKLRKQLSAHASAQSPQRAISRKSDADVADRGMRADVDGGGEAGASAADADADSGASAGAGAGAGTGAGAGAGAGGSDGEGAKFDGGSSADEGEDTEMATMEDALIARLKLLDKVGQTWDEKLAAADAAQRRRHESIRNTGGDPRRRSYPCLVNLNQDPIVTEKLVFSLRVGLNAVGSSEEACRVGLQNADDSATVQAEDISVTVPADDSDSPVATSAASCDELAKGDAETPAPAPAPGVGDDTSSAEEVQEVHFVKCGGGGGVKPHHCDVTVTPGGKVFLVAGPAASETRVNGRRLEPHARVELHNGDRLVLAGTWYLRVDTEPPPSQEDTSAESAKLRWEYAHEELAASVASERASELQTALAAERDATRRQTEAAFQSRLEEEKQRVAAEAAEQVQRLVAAERQRIQAQAAAEVAEAQARASALAQAREEAQARALELERAREEAVAAQAAQAALESQASEDTAPVLGVGDAASPVPAATATVADESGEQLDTTPDVVDDTSAPGGSVEQGPTPEAERPSSPHGVDDVGDHSEGADSVDARRGVAAASRSPSSADSAPDASVATPTPSAHSRAAAAHTGRSFRTPVSTGGQSSGAAPSPDATVDATGATVHSGFLQKKGAVNRGWKRRWCVIADGELRYYKHFPGAGDAWLKHAPTGSLPVEGAKIAIANRGQAHPFAFDVVTETRAFHFEANSEVGPRALPLAPHPADKLVAPRSWNWQTG